MTLDVICIGAANTDLVARTAPPKRFLQGGKEGLEHRRDERAIEEIVTACHLEPERLGGSAFNAACQFAGAGYGCKVGFIGALGKTTASPSFEGRMQELGITYALCSKHDSTPAARCISFVDRGCRTLFTSDGVHHLLAPHLAAHEADLLEYLSGARLIHVAALFDRRLIELLGSAMTRVRDQNPQVLLSIDPGSVWAARVDDATRRLFSLSDYLIVNEDELRLLAPDPRVGATELTAATSLLQRLRSLRETMDERRTTVVVLKDSQGATAYTRPSENADRPTSTQYRRMPLLELQVNDSTGAGDVFAAALLLPRINTDAHVAAALPVAVESARYMLREGLQGGRAVEHARPRVARRLSGNRWARIAAAAQRPVNSWLGPSGPGAYLRAAGGLIGIPAAIVGLIRLLT